MKPYKSPMKMLTNVDPKHISMELPCTDWFTVGKQQSTWCVSSYVSESVRTALHFGKQTVDSVILILYNLKFKTYTVYHRMRRKGQGSRRVKIGPVAEIYDFLICCRIIYLMKKNVIFICFALKLCDIEANKYGYPQRFCNVRQHRLRNKLTSETSQRHPNNFTAYYM